MPTIHWGWCLAERHPPPRKRTTDVEPRAVAALLLARLQQGESLSVLLAGEPRGLAPRDRALVKALCYGTARWWPQLEALYRVLVRRPLKSRDRDVKALLLLGLHQLQHMRIAPHAALDRTVAAARVLGKPWAAGLVNGVLRRFQREREALLADLEQDPVARWAHPAWLLQAVQRAWPEQWQAVVEAANRQPPMSLRVNLRRIGRDAFLERLQQQGIDARPIATVPSGLVLDQPLEVERLPGFREGLVSVQDGGAQLAAGLLAPEPGQRVLDACAAPGGKTGHLLESAPDGVEVTAVEIDPARLQRIRENLERLGLTAEVCQGDAARPAGPWAQRRYQRILLDVPCSATGVIRRHPDIKLLRRASDIGPLTELQARILDAVWPLLEPGGRLLYATCSLLPEENQQQVESFLRRRPDARERPISADWGHACGSGRQILPGEGGMDGFYYACIEKG
ncbi:MAG TPA: 16S rRNA (cytosine(967)-C(5))-methyltransferase RsmB [Sedimenticola thiotaurini]|uniref:16S rRNA (cytosine(967)-C(5))-methyltransferase n=1 Tax=Sedimenticola thiotaurini TaxID=1543721 RepID=A0A831W6J6_9GAMM|nr:16S rRNA (cytosine(967)-C(5))-methyltransferase RsmB [Sedimenticola thiotaurini]